MSISITVTGKFNNGRTKVAGYHSSSNKVINMQVEYGDFRNHLCTEIYANMHKFKKIELNVNLSSHRGNGNYVKRSDIYSEAEMENLIVAETGNINALLMAWQEF